MGLLQNNCNIEKTFQKIRNPQGSQASLDTEMKWAELPESFIFVHIRVIPKSVMFTFSF